ncbi:hypothetical protein [Dyadobacter sp.]|uniref:hypothetical protein n=1 Tax=Dyadobacter sp. TaxID=1914288 RepID=UPI003F7050C5
MECKILLVFGEGRKVKVKVLSLYKNTEMIVYCVPAMIIRRANLKTGMIVAPCLAANPRDCGSGAKDFVALHLQNMARISHIAFLWCSSCQ